MYATAFPDGKLEIVDLVVAGDTAVAEMVGRGTNDGPFGEIPATHRSAQLPYVNVITVREGKVVRDRLYGDQVTLLQQLGLMPEMAQA
jgi:predicted ester cyclase